MARRRLRKQPARGCLTVRTRLALTSDNTPVADMSSARDVSRRTASCTPKRQRRARAETDTADDLEGSGIRSARRSGERASGSTSSMPRTASAPSAARHSCTIASSVGIAAMKSSKLTTGVSCAKFDLCRSCYQKVEEIHPVHAFLSLPDKHVVPAPPRAVETRPPRHHGAFCHKWVEMCGDIFLTSAAYKTLSDRDSTVRSALLGKLSGGSLLADSRDLCIQCEGVGAAGDGSHTADHIMIKVSLVSLGRADNRSPFRSRVQRSRLPHAAPATVGFCKTRLRWRKLSHRAHAPAHQITRPSTRRRIGARRLCLNRRRVGAARQAQVPVQAPAAGAAMRRTQRTHAV